MIFDILFKKHDNYTIIEVGVDDMNLFVKPYIVEHETARLFIIHGICEHSGRYEKTAKRFNEEGISVITFDLRGHGKSSGKRGYVKHFSDFVDDVVSVINEYRNPKVKQFLLGHSMGGLIGHLYMVRNPRVDGYIVSGAPTDYLKKVKLLRIIGYRYFGFIRMKNKFGRNTLTHNTDIEEHYLLDPLNLKDYTIRLGGEMFIRGVKHLNENIFKHTLPILILHGKEDSIVPYEHSVRIHNLILHKEKELILYDHMYHEILNEIENEKVILDILRWIREH